MQDAAYPERLRNIDDPPVLLYCRGTVPAFDTEPVLGIVGTRHASAYGLVQAKQLGYQIGRMGGIVVSGAAAGIDTLSLKGALTAGRPVVGVLGCGIDVVYPANNRGLYEDIAQYGCLMDKAWFASRYDRGNADYVNCSMDQEEYAALVQALATAEAAEVHGFEDSKVFEGCMQESERGGLPHVHGPVSKLIEVDDDYTTAIETALGAAMQNIVVDSEEDGKAAIQMLKRRDGGRATFLPLSAIRGKTLQESGLERQPGYLGLASALVRTDARYRQIVDNLLGRIVITENLDQAVAMTYAELSGERKNAISHRGNALREFCRKYEEYHGQGGGAAAQPRGPSRRKLGADGLRLPRRPRLHRGGARVLRSRALVAGWTRRQPFGPYRRRKRIIALTNAQILITISKKYFEYGNDGKKAEERIFREPAAAASRRARPLYWPRSFSA